MTNWTESESLIGEGRPRSLGVSQLAFLIVANRLGQATVNEIAEDFSVRLGREISLGVVFYLAGRLDQLGLVERKTQKGRQRAKGPVPRLCKLTSEGRLVLRSSIEDLENLE
jgi:hypothetical protein